MVGASSSDKLVMFCAAWHQGRPLAKFVPALSEVFLSWIDVAWLKVAEIVGRPRLARASRIKPGKRQAKKPSYR